MAEPNWKNRTFFLGDNLGFLEAMNSESVDLIATDPPFNKGRDFRATPDSLAAGAKFQDRWSWDQDVHRDWVDQITDSHPGLMPVIAAARDTYSDGMGAFLCFMAMRLLAMRRILKPTGSVYLHCDPTASHYLKQLMDAVFGRRNFKNEVVWCYKSGGASKRQFARKHDIILFYAKAEKLCRFNVLKVKSYGRTGGGQGGAVKYFRDGQGTYSVVSARDWWDISMLSTTHGERLGYPTQKPIALYERMILASSDEGDMVLDPFAGCATTLVAAERLKRQWVGIDIWGNAKAVVLQRLGREGLLAEETAGQRRLFTEDVTFTTDLPERTDDGRPAAPAQPSRQHGSGPDGLELSRAEMQASLLSQQGIKCQGCDRKFDDPRYLEVGHDTPCSDGGSNHLSNRVLLCSPCARAKGSRYTLRGLRRLNRSKGWMAQP